MNWYEDPIYIKMAEKAEEIQALLLTKKLETDDILLFYDKTKKSYPRITHVEDCAGHPFADVFMARDKTSKIIWLPNQSQLQKMVLPDPDRKDAWGEPMPPDPKNDSVFWMFHYFAEAIQERKWSQQTAEQLWLRYVYHKKYGKLWDSEKEEWVE